MKQWIPYIVIVILAVCFALSLIHKKEVVFEKHTTDTITIVRTDTIIERIPRFVSEKVVDTIFLEKTLGDSLELAITQKYYDTDTYKAWVSGYNPNLDSIYVFEKEVTNTVTNTITKNVCPRYIGYYLNAGAMFIDNKVAPYAGLSIKFKNDMTIGANIGLYKKDLFYGFNVGVRLK